jgi:hypothetical protein
MWIFALATARMAAGADQAVMIAAIPRSVARIICARSA